MRIARLTGKTAISWLASRRPGVRRRHPPQWQRQCRVNQRRYPDLAHGERHDRLAGEIETLRNHAHNLGGVVLLLNVGLVDMATAAVRPATTLSNGGKGGFVYEPDTGGLYYRAIGSFSGGGTLIGMITANGATAWTFDANSFTQT